MTPGERCAQKLLRVLNSAKVDYVVAGGVAARAHGLRKKINDLDIVYARSWPNLQRIAAVLQPFSPRPRGLVGHEAVPWNASVLRDGYSFLISTTIGDIDLIAELTDVGTWAAVKRQSVPSHVLDTDCHCLKLEALIRNLHASGRDKDIRLAQRLEGLQRRLRRTADEDIPART